MTKAGEKGQPARVRLMGVLTIPPDSFSDGGKYLAPRAAVAYESPIPLRTRGSKPAGSSPFYGYALSMDGDNVGVGMPFVDTASPPATDVGDLDFY